MTIQDAAERIGRDMDAARLESERADTDRRLYLWGLQDGYKRALEILDGKDWYDDDPEPEQRARFDLLKRQLDEKSRYSNEEQEDIENERRKDASLTGDER